MSSSLGGGGFGGSGNTVRYAIVIDDSQVNSKLNNFQNQLGRLDSATRSSGAGLTTLNNNFQTMDTNLQNSTRDLDAINSNFRTMDSSIQGTSNNMGALNNAFQNASGGLTRFNTLQDNAGDGTRSLGNRMKDAGGFIKDNALAFGAASSAIIGLVGSYTSYQKTQLAAERANVLAERSQQKVVKLQEKLNKMVADGKQGTKQYEITLKDLEIAQDQSAIATERAALATDTANQNAADFFTTSAGQGVLAASAIAQVASGFKDMAPQLRNLGNIAKVAGPALAAVGVAIGTIAGVAAIGILGSAVISKWFKETVQGAQELSDEGGKAIDDFIAKIPGIGEAWNDVEKQFSEWLVNTFPMLFTEQDKAFIKNRQLTKSTNEVADATANVAEKQKIYDEALANYNDKLETRQVGDEKVAKATLDKAKADLDAAKATEATAKASETAATSIFKYNEGIVTTTTSTGDLITKLKQLETDALTPGTKAFHDHVVETIVARNKARELREGWDKLRNDGVNLGKVLTDNTGKQKVWNETLQDWVPIGEKTEDTTGKIMKGTKEYNDILAQFEMRMKTLTPEEQMMNQELAEQARILEEEVTTAYDNFFAKLSEGQDVQAALNIKVDKNKIIKKILDYMPDEIEKDMEIILDNRENIEFAKQGFEQLFSIAANDMNLDEAGVDKMVNGYIKYLGEKFPNDPGVSQMQDDLAEAVAGNNTEQKVKNLIAGWNDIKVPASLDLSASSLGSDSNSTEIEGSGGMSILADDYKVSVPHVTIKPKKISLDLRQGGPADESIGDKTAGGGGWSGAGSGFEQLRISVPSVTVTPKELLFDNLGNALNLAQTGIEKFQNTAIKAIDVIAKRIDSLTSIQPNISLQNKLAIKANDVIAKRIMNLEKLDPQINLKNNKAIKAVDAVAKRIMSLENLNPVVTVKVKYTGVKSFAQGGSFITQGPELIMVGDNPSGKERVNVTPLSNSGGPPIVGPTLNKTSPTYMNMTNVIRIDGNDLINTRELKKLVKMELGKNRDRFG